MDRLSKQGHYIIVQWRSEGILRPGANKNFAPPVFYNSMIICTSTFVLSSYIGRLSFCIATTFKIFFHKFSRFIQKRFKLGSPFSTLSSTLFFWHNLPTSLIANYVNSKNAYLFLEIRDIIFNGAAIFLSQRRAGENITCNPLSTIRRHCGARCRTKLAAFCQNYIFCSNAVV